MQELIEFDSSNHRLAGFWRFPASDSVNLPAVIFCHGFTGNHIESKRLYSRITERLAEIGIASFRFDHRGCGDSSGDFIDFTPRGLLTDLEAAFDVFIKNPRIDKTRTAVVGYSLGGTSASFLLNHWPEWHTAAIWAGVAQPEIIRDRLAGLPGFEGYRERGYFDNSGFRVSAEYIDTIGELKPLDWIAGYRKPVLFITGADDPIVKPSQMQLFLEKRKVDEDQGIMIQGADHGFTTAINGDLVIDHTANWFVERFGVQ